MTTARLPTAMDLTVHSRQNLVQRLDKYQREQPELFNKVVDFVAGELLPHVGIHSCSGRAHL